LIPRRGIQAGLALLALAGTGAIAGCGGKQATVTSTAEASNRWLTLRGANALLHAPCPEPVGLLTSTPSKRKLAQARRGVFPIFDVPTHVAPPVDWHRDPIRSHRWRETFLKLRWLHPLLYAYRQGDRAALRQALAIALDWVQANPHHAPTTPFESWTNKVVGDRAPYLAYITRAAACEGMLDREQARALLESIRRHGGYLARLSTFSPTNHGLFVDTGLEVITRYLPFIGPARRWDHLARREFEQTLSHRLAEGMWLEHSSAYQFLVIDSLEHFIADLGGGDATLERQLARMKLAAAWFVEPDGQIAQFGDSDRDQVPGWANDRASKLNGLKVYPRAGFAFVRAPGPGGEGSGYLAVASDFHNTTHKHADDLSFELYDRGHRIVDDTGLYQKDPGPERTFVLSAAAHSVLTVDGREFPVLDESAAYGSGIVATGQGAGWYGIEARNPLVRRQGVEHHRLFLYRPGVALIVLDRLRSTTSHRYTRHFQLGQDLDITDADASTLALRAGGLQGRLYDAPAPTPAVRTEARGQSEPLSGWTSPSFRVFRPRWSIALTSRAADSSRVATFALDRRGLRATGVQRARGATTLTLRARSEADSSLVVSRRGGKLSISRGG
jgi:hypothetical protein